MRSTKLKQLTRHILETTATPVSVPDILEALAVLKISANKTTIYRELESLMQQGIISELDFGEGKKRYELTKDHHHHLICEKCNAIEHVDLDELENTLQTTQSKIGKQRNFHITHHSLELFGLCKGCQA